MKVEGSSFTGVRARLLIWILIPGIGSRWRTKDGSESWHILSLLGNGVRQVLTCLTDAAPQGFHYKPSSLLKGLLY